MGRVKSRRDAQLEARILIRGIAAVVCPGKGDAFKIDCMAKELHWTLARTESIWRGKVNIESWEMDALRAYRPKL